jgi:outer membrane lipoprotein-sorting protein
MLSVMFFREFTGVCLAAMLVCIAAGACAENEGAGMPTGLSSVEVVEQMHTHIAARIQELKHYKALRHYQVEYKGYSATIVGRMDVEANYDAGQGMSFRIVSQSGSKFLCDKVLKRALDSEVEASRNRASAELTPANYKFQMVNNETIDGRPAYILKVEPLSDGKFLFRGRIWVDAADFEVAKMETEPAKNPSFFISRTLIHYTGAPAHGFWLPRKIRSETKVRIGGTAVLTIDYGTYEVESKTPNIAGN